MKDNKNKVWCAAVLGGVFVLILLMNLLTPMVCDDYRYAFSFADGRPGSRQFPPHGSPHGYPAAFRCLFRTTNS